LKSEIPRDSGPNQAQALQIPYIETSAIRNVNVHMAISKLLVDILDQHNEAESEWKLLLSMRFGSIEWKCGSFLVWVLNVQDSRKTGNERLMGLPKETRSMIALFYVKREIRGVLGY